MASLESCHVVCKDFCCLLAPTSICTPNIESLMARLNEILIVDKSRYLQTKMITALTPKPFLAAIYAAMQFGGRTML
eukprot:2245476-Amphidinium_carterae.1